MRYTVFFWSNKIAAIFLVLLLNIENISAKSITERESVKSGNITIKLDTDAMAAKSPLESKNLPSIEVDSSNVRILDRKIDPEAVPKKGEIILKTKTAPDTLAKELANESSKTIIEWRPFFNANGIRGIRIPAVALSHDRSVLAFAETTGTESGPNGTRIIAMNTYTWEPMKVFHVAAKITHVEFIPGSHKIAIHAAKQDKLNQQDSIGIIDLDAEKITALYALPEKTQIVAICASNTHIFAALKNSGDVIAYPVSEEVDNNAPIKMTCIDSVSALAITPNNLFIAAISQKHITFFKVSDCKKYSEDKLDLPWSPTHLVFLDSEKNFFLSPSVLQDASPILIRDGRKIPFDGRSGGYALVTKDKKNVFIGYKVKGQIDRIDSVTADILERTQLEQIRPQTIGDPLYVYYLDHRNFIFVLDTNGNGYIAAHAKGENRWRKTVIFTAKK